MESICQQCFCFDCAWHKRFEEVDGWTAQRTKITNEHGIVIDSFCVERCPLYRARDGSKWIAVSFADVVRLLGKKSSGPIEEAIAAGRKHREFAEKGVEVRIERVLVDEKEKRRYFIREKEQSI